jgi:hypothetical protein
LFLLRLYRSLGGGDLLLSLVYQCLKQLRFILTPGYVTYDLRAVHSKDEEQGNNTRNTTGDAEGNIISHVLGLLAEF